MSRIQNWDFMEGERWYLCGLQVYVQGDKGFDGSCKINGALTSRNAWPKRILDTHNEV